MSNKKIPLSTYFKKLAEVQASLACAYAMDRELEDHMGNSAAILCIELVNAKSDVDQVKKFFEEVSTLRDGIRVRTKEMIKKITDEVQELKINQTRLPTLLQKPEIMVQENFDALTAFETKIGTIVKELRHMRMEVEIELVRRSGFGGPDFKL